MDDDPVVREIPVHLADELRQNLYMVQFPLRPTYRPMPEPPRRARIKPNNQLMQIDFPVDQRSEHFDQDAEEYLKQKHLRLHSSSVPALSNYVVGVFRQGQLHLTPLSAIMQMRPSLSHIDDAANEEEEDMEVEEKMEPPPVEMKEVQFQFKKKQSERAMSAIQNSYAYKKQQIDAENWIELQVQDKSSAGADDEFENLFSEKEAEVMSTMTPDEYIKALQYRAMATVEKLAAPSNPAQYEDKDETMNPVTGRLLDAVDAKFSDVLRLLATDQIMHFDTLAKLLPSRNEEELLDALKHVAVHVRGRLLPSSAFVCRGETTVRGRNEIIKALSKATTGVSRTELVEDFSLDADVTKTILSEFAVLDSTTRKWSFRLGPDNSFTKRFPAVGKAIKL
ncbi:DNA-directed RNA polymerase III subunit RPC5-like protein [Phytophthora infestans T30-4]|uniref:DNA-directed RNA polymerase III subunit RPC5-like protein n=1 Tax=Phytophthora infestans (strain T30-4) TaxID=403677 RepID=D0NBY8_PHYIT|nr:DNA-directed RNA polymerase III subunit RPC5-like protein [Phytophthora infestans T30-4]EEY55502.1 DNA-directed RNA polymerase III subunit RPC5-like protein [Phytophthora infestans T30-4]|eukprot:XP_002903078.1 DNA-directed RNA polymerase III subunit RPC5-like protein [Phytophthora infestans T30-4]